MQDRYFNTLYRFICNKKGPDVISFRKLLRKLYDTKFTWSMPKDANRASDGIDLRDRFKFDIDGPCNLLEMMIALAIRCEETIMDDPAIGDRTRQWFWGMITSLGLGGMVDSNYDEELVDKCIQRFLNREYDRNGKGGLFTIKRTKRDLREVEIWIQLLWYLDNII